MYVIVWQDSPSMHGDHNRFTASVHLDNCPSMNPLACPWLQST